MHTKIIVGMKYGIVARSLLLSSISALLSMDDSADLQLRHELHPFEMVVFVMPKLSQYLDNERFQPSSDSRDRCCPGSADSF